MLDTAAKFHSYRGGGVGIFEVRECCLAGSSGAAVGQDLERQIDALMAVGIARERIYLDNKGCR